MFSIAGDPSSGSRCVRFVIAGADRHVVVLQARPYKVTYTKGQRLDDLSAPD